MHYDKKVEEIGKRIKSERKRLGLTQESLLEQIHLSRQSRKTMIDWETGKRIPDLDSLARMADVFKCDVGYLLCDYDVRVRTISDVCECTGLSENAVHSLLRLQLVKLVDGTYAVERGGLSKINILNSILECLLGEFGFEEVLRNIQKAKMVGSRYIMENAVEFSPEEIKHANEIANACGKVVLDRSEAEDHYLEHAMFTFRGLIDYMHTKDPTYSCECVGDSDEYSALLSKIKDEDFR